MSRRKTERPGPAASRALQAEKRERKERQKTHSDAWQNLTTGLGVPFKDWRLESQLLADAILDRQQIDDLYSQDNLAAKIVDAIPEHATRRWMKLMGVTGPEGIDFQQAVDVHLDRLQAPQMFSEWMRLGRKDGGALMLVGADDGHDLDEPLDFSRIREIRHLHILERWMVVPDVVDIDPLSPNFGKPLFYMLLPRALQASAFSAKVFKERTSGVDRIHYSRLFIDDGIQVSERRKVEQLGFGYSVLQRAWEPIRRYRVAWGHIESVLKHLAQTIMKFSGLAQLKGADFQNTLNARLAQIHLARSTFNVVPIDKEDELIEQVVQLTGVSDMLSRAQDDLAQAADMPLTLLFGHSPLGFSSDDQPGMRNFYDSVALKQQRVLVPPLTTLIKMIISAYKIPEPENWKVDFLPLVEPTDNEISEQRNKDADTAHKYWELGALDATEIRATLKNDPKSPYIIMDGPETDDDGKEEDPLNPQPNVDPKAPVAVGGKDIVTTEATVLNGAQITSALEIVNSVALGELPRDSAVQMLAIFFNIGEEQANKILGSVGVGFKIEKAPEPASVVK